MGIPSCFSGRIKHVAGTAHLYGVNCWMMKECIAFRNGDVDYRNGFSLQSFALTDVEGGFELKSVPEGEFILQASFIEMEPLNQPVTVERKPKEIDLGEVRMVHVNTSLDAVRIEGEMIPIQIKGDTIEYNADAFKTQPNASVEDLLKRLPGLEVDSDGQVKAQGKP